MYKVCGKGGCPGSAILAGFNDAIADRVDLLSVSVGASAFYRPDFADDPIAIGTFHAVVKGIAVVYSAGNNGPTVGSVMNAAPWILTVAATTIGRDFESDSVLGGTSKAVKGRAISPISDVRTVPGVADTIIGFLDTGIWPELVASEQFRAVGRGFACKGLISMYHIATSQQVTHS